MFVHRDWCYFILMITIVFTLASALTLSTPTARAAPLPAAEARFHRDTGLTFADALSAVQTDTLAKKEKLNRTIRRADLEKLLKSKRAEVDRRKSYCASFKANQACDADVKALHAQVDQLAKVITRFDALGVSEKFALGLLLYQDKMKNEILAKDIERWSTSCGTKDRVNTPACRETIAKVYRPLEIVEKLFVLAQAQDGAHRLPASEFHDLKTRIAQYEQR